MPDVKVNTSESPRCKVYDLIASEEGWEKAPDEVHFLGGSNDGEGDYDLFLFRWAEDNELQVVATRFENDQWEVYQEVLEDVDASSSAELLVEAKRRAQGQGLIPATNPADETGFSDEHRLLLPTGRDMGIRRTHQDALFLGGAAIDGKQFELYLAERVGTEDPRDNQEKQERVYAIPRDATSPREIISWWADGSVPSGSDAGIKALREVIRRALKQGFTFKVDTRRLAKFDDNQAAPATVAASTSSSTAMVSTAGASNMIDNGSKKKVTKFTQVTVVDSQDEQIHLPPGMSKAQAREWLTQLERNEEQLIQWSEVFDAYPLDGALALKRVLASRFGAAVKAGATIQTFFGPKEVPPFVIKIEVGVEEFDFVPWGHFTIPLMPEHKIEVGSEYKEKQLYFQISGEIKRKYQPMMDEIARQVREELKAGSIYKGKAFRLKFPTDAESKERGYDPNDFAPRFIDTAKPADRLILSDKVREQVETNLFTPVEQTALCLQHGIPLKRGILLEGKYGTGKTLTANILSKLAVDNGWTFIYLQNVKDLEKAMRFAKRYEPAIIFAEDIDAVMQQKEGSARDKEMNDILNTIDGVDMKKAQQMVVLTSNFVERINKAMLRPGRLDAVITIEPPDEAAVIQLFRHYAKGLLGSIQDEELRPAAELLAGQIPSVVREVVERSKLASIRRAGKEKTAVSLQGDDLRVAAAGIMAHIALLTEKPMDSRSDIEKAADRLGGWLAAVLANANNGASNGASTAHVKAIASTPGASGKAPQLPNKAD